MGDLFASQNLREYYALHSLGQIVGCAYIIIIIIIIIILLQVSS